tara:strand:- start:757 stop:2448 length:1692 start_codon:yes stop_codon:yes gene_type:complete
MVDLPPVAGVQPRQLIAYDTAGQVPVAQTQGGGQLVPLLQAVMQGGQAVAEGFSLPEMMAQYARATDPVASQNMSGLERLFATNPAINTMAGGIISKLPQGAVLGSSALRRQGDNALPEVQEAVTNPMIVQHNINPQALRIVDEIGGLPMPSLAISRVEEPLTDFGNISLVASKDMATPSAQNFVYPADAYTGRQPQVFFKDFVNNKESFEALQNDPMLSHLDDVTYFHGMYDSIADADKPLKQIQAAVASGAINPKDYNKFYDLQQAASQALGENRFNEDFLNTFDGLSKYGTLRKSILPRGGVFTPSGNRRKFPEYTLDEAVKRMKSDKAFEKGTEKGGMLGAGRLRAMLLDKFKTLDEIKEKRNLLVSSQEFEELKDYVNSDVAHTIEDLAAKHFNDNFRGAQDFLEDIASNKNPSWAKDLLGDDYDEAVKIAKGNVQSFKAGFKDMITEYFEAKPKRAVSLDEFAGAIVPKEVSPQTLAILERHGITDIYKYGTEEERRELFKKFPDLFFSGAPLPTSSLFSSQEMSAPAQADSYPNYMPPQAPELDANPLPTLPPNMV